MDLQQRLQSTLGELFAFESELAGGGMSRVFVAEELALKRRVVVKVLPADMAALVSIERFSREIRLAAVLQHPNIVPVISTGSADGLPYYTMPLVRGETLRARIERGALPVGDAVGILRDIARALRHAHDEGIVHRDIKPENILLCGGIALVTDFGVAKAIDASRTNPSQVTLTQVGSVVGTPMYMAPEQAAGDECLDHRADLYSLGVLAFEMLAGKPPFTGASTQAILAAHIAEPPPDLASKRTDVPTPLAELIMKCLVKDPELRPQSAGELLASLEDAAVIRSGAFTTERRVQLLVLPLVNLSAQADDEFFSDGITEDIIAQLSMIRDLRIISRTSAMQFKGSKQPLADMARAVRATHVLEGSVRRAGHRLRVVAHLTSAHTEEHLWTQTFDRDLTDVFAIQTELAERIADALKSRLTPNERARIAKRPTADMEAYNLFLLGRRSYHSLTSGANPLADASKYLELAITRDPKFALAHAWLALVHMYHAGGFWGIRPSDAWARALPSARRALELDQQIAEAHVVLGMHALWVGFDWSASRSHFDQAYALNPNDSFGCICRIGFELAMGDRDAMQHWARLAEAMDPSSPLVLGNIVAYMYFARLFDESLAVMRAAHGLMLDAMGAVMSVMEANVRVSVGEIDDARVVLAGVKDQVFDNFTTLMMINALARTGDFAAAREKLAELHRKEATEYVWAPGMSAAYGALGDLDRAFEYLERGYQDRAAFMTWLALPPFFDPMRSDPRFAEMMRRVGIPAAAS